MYKQSAVLRKSRNCTDPVARQFAARNRTVNIGLIGNAAVWGKGG
jgi:surface antigen